MIQSTGNNFALAQWITASQTANRKNCCFRVFKEFYLKDIVFDHELCIASEGYYLIHVNGAFLHSGPIRGTRKINYFDRISLAGKLNKGKNSIAIAVYTDMSENFNTASTIPAVICEIPDVIGSDASWKATIAPDFLEASELYSMQIGFMELRDMRLAPENWQNGAGSISWPFAEEINNEELNQKILKLRNIPPLRETICNVRDIPIVSEIKVEMPENNESIGDLLEREKHIVLMPSPEMTQKQQLFLSREKHELIVNPTDQGGIAYIFDFYEDKLGYPEIELVTGSEAIADLTFGEEIFNGRIRSGFEHYNFTDRYFLRSGKNLIGSHFAERGGRYIQLTLRNFTAPISIKSVRMVDRHYDLKANGSFFSSDEKLNQIFNMCVKTLEICTSDVFIDCPWREHAFWINDLIVQNRTSLEIFGAQAIHKRAFELAFSQQRTDGWIPGVCPAPGKNGESGFVLPATNLFLFQMLEDYWLYSGNDSVIKLYLPQLGKIIDAVEKEQDENGLVKAPEEFWNFYDWGFELASYHFNRQCESMFNFLYIIALKCYMRLSEAAGNTIDNKRITKRIKQLSSLILDHFMNQESGLLVDPVFCSDILDKTKTNTEKHVISHLAHAFALLSQELPERVAGKFINALTNENLHTSDYYLQYFILDALGKNQLGTNALKRIRTEWGKCVEQDSKTIYEIGIHDFGTHPFGGTGSLCHGFATAPIDFVQRFILGIEPLQPGFREFKFNPNLFDLKFAEGRIPTPHGIIEIKISPQKTEIKVPHGTIVRMDNTLKKSETCLIYT